MNRKILYAITALVIIIILVGCAAIRSDIQDCEDFWYLMFHAHEFG